MYGTVRFEGFATRLLLDQDTVVFAGEPYQPPPVLAVWIAYLYGYSFTHVDPVTGPHRTVVMHFVRDDDPEARRRSGWMRNPAADPAFPSPVSWVIGGDGFNPPGWRPDVRVVVPPEQQASLASMQQELEREAGKQSYGNYAPPPRSGRPVHPPGPPPDVIAHPDQPRQPYDRNDNHPGGPEQ
ncbi:hypothetical protein [Streptacidiphilus sp. PAMC 29251]